MRRLLEQQGEVAPLERPFGPSTGLDRSGQVEQVSKLTHLEIGDVKEVTAKKSAH